jgi:type VI secretion system protein ImpC
MDEFGKLSNPRDLSRVLDSTEYAKWRSFRDTDESRYVALTLPTTLARVPYGPDGMPVENVNFVEEVDCGNSDDFVWSNSAWYLAERVTAAFAAHGWTAAIRGVEGGGLVEALPLHTFKGASGDIEIVCPTETPITDRREKELSDLGFLPLVFCKGTDTAAFFGGQTANKPVEYDDDSASANAKLSARLPYIFAASRFAHYFKVMLRDKIGSFENADSVQNYLQSWVSKFILLDDNGSHASKARFPLREARVDVTEVAGSPGEYRAIAYLKPHFQLEEIDTSIRLVATLPPPAA